MLIPSPSMVFVIQDEKEAQTETGILLAERNKRKANHGTIYSINADQVCPHCTEHFKRTDLKNGDRVLFSRYVAEQIEVDELKGKIVFSIPIDAILAKIA